jgi:hypothetical protein
METLQWVGTDKDKREVGKFVRDDGSGIAKGYQMYPV